MNEEQYLTNLVRLIDQSISESFEKSDYEIIQTLIDEGHLPESYMNEIKNAKYL